jgi:uncharacterized protein YggE
MRQSLLTIALVLVFATLAMAQRGGEANDQSVIVVNGDGLIRVPPDEATVRIGILRQASTAQTAQEQANTVANEILAAITKAGIPSSQIQTSRLSLTPIYPSRVADPGATPRISAYQASNVVSVRVLDLGKVGAVIDAALRAGANEIQGVLFGLRNDLAARQQALKEAVSEAQMKAETIADAIHAHLGPAIEINEHGASVIPRTEFAAGMARTAEMAPTPVTAGEVEVHASVTVRYRIVNSPARPD